MKNLEHLIILFVILFIIGFGIWTFITMDKCEKLGEEYSIDDMTVKCSADHIGEPKCDCTFYEKVGEYYKAVKNETFLVG